MYTPRTSVEAIPNAIANASIHHSALQNRDFGHTYDRSRALVKAIDPGLMQRCGSSGGGLPAARPHACVRIDTRVRVSYTRLVCGMSSYQSIELPG
jgi:hypothetical protein